MAVAQESCDSTSAFKKTANGGMFTQKEACGDADIITTFRCVKGKATIDTVMNIAMEGQKSGAKLQQGFEFSGKNIKQEVNVIDAASIQMDLATDGELWRGLSTPGLDVYMKDNGGSTAISTVSSSRKNLAKFKKECGL